MKDKTSNTNTFSSLAHLLAATNAHFMTKCIRIYHEQLVAHNLTVADVQPLLDPSTQSCFMSTITEQDVMKAKIKAELLDTDYVKPKPYLVIAAPKKNSTQDINNKLDTMFKKQSNQV
tara:strand:+ start:68 stop:421 length:354 start_codon:yes stop_codon:yes gene_type:complete